MKRRSASMRGTGPKQKLDVSRMNRINKLLDRTERNKTMSPTTMQVTTTTTKLTDDNAAYWEQHRGEWPAHVKTQRTDPAYPRPETLSTNLYGAFLRVPLGEDVMWAFSSDLHAQRFIDDFGGEILL